VGKCAAEGSDREISTTHTFFLVPCWRASSWRRQLSIDDAEAEDMENKTVR
jgi:hypothetical protein